MEKQEYINTLELMSVLHAKDMLDEVVPENSKVITKEDHKKVMDQLQKWQNELFKQVNVK